MEHNPITEEERKAMLKALRFEKRLLTFLFSAIVVAILIYIRVLM